MKNYLFIATLFLGSLGATAQEYHEKCGANIELQKELQDPENKAKYDAFQEAVLRYTADPDVAVIRENGVRIIPTVFHILHDGGSENILVSRVMTQMEVLNEDFRRLNADTANMPERFYGDTEYTHFVFNSDGIADFVGDSSYIRLTTRYKDTIAFHFNDGGVILDSALTTQVNQVVEVDISSASDTADIAMALANAINAQNGFIATYINDGQHRVEVMNDGLGEAFDVLVGGLWPITSTLIQQGGYWPADCNIEFRLATKDPLGNCTDGIVRVFTPKTNDANNGTGFKAESYWNAYSYLNVWVVNNIGGDLPGGGIILGYAQFPASGLLSTDGIAVIASNINVATQGGRTATHEVGHWLSLIHVWGDQQCGSDNVLDTPIHNEPNFGICGNATGGGSTTAFHDTPYNVPGCDPDNPNGEMFNNYMDYSSDLCMNMFTRGQKARMDFTFNGSGTDPGIRSFLISDTNLVLTGVADPYLAGDCAPISAFYFQQSINDFATQKMICEGEDVQFKEASYNGVVDDFLWNFDGGDPGSDTDEDPQVSYNTPGIYDVTLEVSNAQGSNSLTQEAMVIVSSNTAQFQNDWGYVDSYWEEQGFLDDYFVFNQDGSENKWEWYFGEDGGSIGWESVRLYNIDNDLGAVDELISPSYNLSTLSNPTLKFRYSGAAIDNTPDDELRVMKSKNCGKTWSQVTTLSGFELTNAGLVSESYRPDANTVWTDVSASLGNFDDEENVRIKFKWTSGDRSNNFYIDDLTLSASPLGMEDLEQQIGLSIAPNPTIDKTSVTMSLPDASLVQLEIVDVLGRDVKKIFSQEMTNGTHRFDIDLSTYDPGVYFLRISVGKDMLMKKVVKN